MLLQIPLALLLSLAPSEFVLRPHTLSQSLPSQSGQAQPKAWLVVGLVGVDQAGDEQAGTALSSVQEASPAARAGLVQGDVLVSIDGRPTDTAQAVIDAVGSKSPRASIAVRLRREFTVTLDAGVRGEGGRLALGVELRGNGDDSEGATALQIARVAPNTPAAAAGLKARDQLVAIDGNALSTFADLAQFMQALAAPRALRVTVERELRVRLGQRPDAGAFEATPRSPWLRDSVVEPRVREPNPQPAAPAFPQARADLREELRALRAELAALRAELAALRDALGTPARR